MQRMTRALGQIEPQIGLVEAPVTNAGEAPLANGSSNAVAAVGQAQHTALASSTSASSSSLSSALPITLELVTFAAQCHTTRRKTTPPQPHTQTPSDAIAASAHAADSPPAMPASALGGDAAAALTVTPESAASAASASTVAAASVPVESAASSHSASAGAVAAVPSADASSADSSSSAAVPPKHAKQKPAAGAGKFKSKVKGDADLAFLDSLLRKEAEEAERKAAKERKKREKAMAAAAVPKQPASASAAAVGASSSSAASMLQPPASSSSSASASDKHLAEALVDLQLASASSASARAPDLPLDSLAEAAVVSTGGSSSAPATAPVAKKKKKNKKKGATSTTGGSAAAESEVNGDGTEEASATAAVDPAPAAPSAELDATAEPAVSDDASTVVAAGEEEVVAPAAPLPPRKQQRVHRVEDEEEWSIVLPASKGGGGGKQKQKAAASAQPQQKQKSATTASAAAGAKKPSQSESAAVASSPSVSSAAAASPLPPASTLLSAPAFLPSFPRLLTAFASHRQGQQEDAQELLHVLCENVQREWNAWIGPIRRQAGYSTAASSVSASSADSAAADGDWSEIGKGSRPIKVVSNLAFDHTPLSALFCGRVRSQLTVQNRAQDTMSFQPFWSLHLEINDDRDAAPALSNGDKGHSKHRRKTQQMSVERALERYMCPSSIEGYRKRGGGGGGASGQTSGSGHGYGYDQPQTAKATHMHALDSHSLPRILVLHLKRFEQHERAGGSSGHRTMLSKSLKHVRFHRRLHLPASYLGTAAATTSSSPAGPSGVSYNLCSVVVHHGHSMAGGHYTAFVRDGSNTEQARESPVPQAATDASAANRTAAASKSQKHPQHSQGKGGKQAQASKRKSVDSDNDSSDDEHDGSSHHAASQASDEIDRDVWYHCDDTRITPVAAHTVYAQQAYILLYVLDEQAMQVQAKR